MTQSIRFNVKNREISIVGTGHVMKKSVEAVKKEIAEFKPDVVAIELDMNRFIAMNRNAKAKPKTPIQFLLMEIQNKAAKTTGIKAGTEMMTASNEARKHNIPTVLIDRDIRITLQRGLGNMTLKEKLKLVWGLIGGFFEVGNKAQLDALIDQKEELMEEFKKELPSIYRALVTERDRYMANAILKLPHSKILVVVGAGHVRGIKKGLEYRN